MKLCRCLIVLFAAVVGSVISKAAPSPATVDALWALDPLPDVQLGSGNAVDSVLEPELRARGIEAAPPADRLTFLRRVSFDLIGLPPTIEEQEAFVSDTSADAYEKVIDRLLSSEQHGVRYARRWLDVLRYADVDDRMPAASSIHLWRDWMIRALNRNLPYDAFVRTQISGYESSKREEVSATGFRRRLSPRPDSQFALGFLARGASTRSNDDHALAISAAETVSSAFLGMTLHCAKCHDHMYDPILQKDYYSMKALFDPLVVREVPLATAEQIIEYGDALRVANAKRDALEQEFTALAKPYFERLFDERVAMLPAEIQAVIRKPEALRTAEEVKIADDYFPIVRIDSGPIGDAMPPEIRRRYEDLRRQRDAIRLPESLPSFLTVEEDSQRLQQVSYVLGTGEPDRPDKGQPVEPGFLFQPAGTLFREGRRETFVDWLTAPDNALFARVAVNRVWQWHFGKGLHATANDFGSLTGTPKLRAVLDRLAADFVTNGFDMKWLHKTIVMSQAYQRVSIPKPEQLSADPNNDFYGRFPLQRLEAEAIHDSIVMLAGRLDLELYGPSFGSSRELPATVRRAAYMKRGFHPQRQELPAFLDTFDAQDGRDSCPRREETVTAPQALWLMNNTMVNQAAEAFGKRLNQLGQDDLSQRIRVGYRLALGREPGENEMALALDYMKPHPDDSAKLAWMLFNLDEFIYIR
ncbi:MAG: DUF1553 domain-containing protein [Verrucomicrobiae bacterium]|nr:DUF1553 domain-containing protein [Verrucomicrobiae bacterium]